MSIPYDYLRFDQLTASVRHASRSAAVVAAIRELRLREFGNDCTEAYDEWIADGGELWDVTIGGGVE